MDRGRREFSGPAIVARRGRFDRKLTRHRVSELTTFGVKVQPISR